MSDRKERRNVTRTREDSQAPAEQAVFRADPLEVTKGAVRCGV